MKTPRTNTSAVDTQFDEWAKALAHGLTRRKTLQLIGGTFTGALLALRGTKASAAPSTGVQGCGHICAPLFSPQNQGAFAACTQACEDCQSCQGIPTMTSTQVLVCNNATPCRNSGSGLMCCSGGQNCCGGVCCNTDCCGGKCLPACSPGFTRDPSTCQCVSINNQAAYTCSDGSSHFFSCFANSCESLRAAAEESCAFDDSSVSLAGFSCTPCTLA